MFGFRARNDNGVIQVSADRPYLSLHEKGTVNIGTAYNTLINFSTPCTTVQPPLIFFRSAWTSQGEGLTLKCGVVGSPGNWTGFRLINANTTQLSISDWFAAVWSPLQAAGPFGMRVRDASGTVCFHSSSQLIKFSRFITTWTYLSGNSNISTYTSGQTLASDEYALVSQCHSHSISTRASTNMHIGVTVTAAGVIGLVTNPSTGSLGLGYFPVLLAKIS